MFPTLGQMPIDKITSALVRRWHTETLQRGEATARKAYATLRAVFSTAVEDDLVTRNPRRIPGAGTPRITERPLLSRAQVEDLAGKMPSHLQPLVLTAFWGHLRLGEVIALRWADIDLQAGTLAVRQAAVETEQGPMVGAPKAHSTGEITLSPPAVEALRHHREGHPGLPTALVFTRPDGSPLRHHHVQHPWRTIRVKAGLPKARLHDLRHAGLTLAAQCGATVAELQHRGRHKSLRAALHYQHAARSRDAEIARRMAGETPSSAEGGAQVAQEPDSDGFGG